MPKRRSQSVKRKPTHDLAAIKAAYSDPAKIRRTVTAARDAMAMGFETQDVVDVIQGMSRRDFDKSATAHNDIRQWMDSYMPVVDGVTLYLKFTTDGDGNLLLTSFKKADL
ncbi:MAG: type II toxin-antitoxin system MqsR family toxin [Proteobacteria bacterium]|nr:type II toxin-antitoxin system MqsR family toxin [Pseudomonadota bacterium]MBI3498530.1 type II toxin-antitoxin system MqsR family toxin [Pseudomonadota bacterium]